MSHSQRGKAVIFNQMTFLDPALSTRFGSDQDAKNLEKTLSSLGFDVATHTDLKLQDIENELDLLADQDHTERDSLFVAILTHGDESTVASNDNSFSPHFLWRQFNAEKCPSLAGKPKLFLLQACRGTEPNKPASKQSQTNNALSKMEIPSHGSDVLLLYGTIHGFLSVRDPAKGSLLVQAFCSVMKDAMFSEELLSILTEVCRLVAEEDEFKCDVDIDGQTVEIKQMVCFTSMLTRKVQFNKK
eukprot:GFUD01066245.1.p1 GENE.GFUD01066245.1~~GFUD01066245.1.p1  ORF type:complete len:260 (-),score=44.91 GFUD01066245.1:116-847(-)